MAPKEDWPRICWHRQSGQQAVETWLAAHPEATRIRRAVEEIAASGLTLAKLTVAANLLGDLVKA